MSKMAAAAGPSADPPPEIVMGSKPSGSPATSTVAVPPGCGVGPDRAVDFVACTLSKFEMPADMLATTFTVDAVLDFFAVVADVAAFAVVAVAPPADAVVAE